MITINELIEKGSKLLSKKGVEESELDAQVILADELKCDRLKLIMDYNKEVNQEIAKNYNKKIVQRAARIPLSYIIGRKEFMGMDFIVSNRVLIPRPETEILVEETVKLVNTPGFKAYNMLYVLDIGAGSGNVSIALAKLTKNTIITGIDVSKESVKIAKQNAKILKAEKKVDFQCIDLLSKGFSKLPVFDIIISNPPYVTAKEFAKLQPEIHFEPKTALDGGSEGLVFYEYMSTSCIKHINKNGYFLLETGYNQADKVKKIFESKGFATTKIVKDLSGHNRVVIFKWTK
ncbi:MAG: peptide chain release factor N(5)-glutamine methyltransferase [Elusimicrobia bacterium]|nr:peptide chain release factor N(5)-glutamine methyltransferase [Elusimicrobiota bacterium]MBU2614428.1 peptide chain release factor N(5)-glutamine methyltransferase [Elusimicrobiota bacterium]